MLVLSRKKNESIVINGNIRIEVLQIKGKQIRLGITAPPRMKVLRGELPARRKETPGGKTAAEQPPQTSPLPGESSQAIDCDLSNLAAVVSATA